ncbi:MAG: hypothetical protein IJ005_06910 [Bacteroidales bacterium]|nr:hypothetical protein [Bacteroidales bacterium]
MKRLITLLSLLAVLAVAAPEASAQGFLKKIKDKAENAVGEAIMKKLGLEDAQTPENQSVMQDSPAEPEKPLGPVSASDQIPKLRVSSVVWENQVVPSKASDVYGLIDDLPSFPTAEQIAEYDESTYRIYYDKIAAVNMRVEELDEQQSCSDEAMIAAREDLMNDLADLFGLTETEMKRLEDPDISPEEEERLTQKMIAHMTGGMDMDSFTSKAESSQARMAEISKEMEVYEKKAEKGTLTEAEKQRMQELNQEMMAMTQDLMGGMGNIMQTATKAAEITSKVNAEQTRFQNALKQYTEKVEAIRRNEDGVVKTCEEIASEYEAGLKAIYEQIYRTSDAESVRDLYDQADEMMKNYRLRAAKVWLQGLQVRFDNTVKLIPEAEKVYADMAAGGMIPECAVGRAPLNLVTECTDILNEAYADFPQPEVLPVEMEVISVLNENERLMRAESGFPRGFSPSSGAGDIRDEFINGSCFLVWNDAESSYYKIENGNRVKLSGEGPFDFYKASPKPDESVYGDIPHRSGSRKASYTRSGSLILHDGTYMYPMFMRRHSDRLEFVIYDHIPGTDKEGFMKCTYKL